MTELMKQYEKETGNEVQSDAFAQHEIWEYIRWLEFQLTDQTLEKFQEIIRTQCDEISALKAQLTWRPVSEKPEKKEFYLVKTPSFIFKAYFDGEKYKKVVDEKLVTVPAIYWLPIPPAQKGE